MGKSFDTVLRKALPGVIRPVIELCIRHGVRIQEISEVLKVALVDAASKEIGRAGQEVNVSRISLVTGMHRRDVVRIHREGDQKESPIDSVTGVIGAWQHDRRFLDRKKEPRILTLKGRRSEFRALVRSVHASVDPGTVLLELERVGAVKRVPGGLELVLTAYVTRGPRKGFELLQSDLRDLIASVEGNLHGREEIPNFHGSTTYDNIFLDKIPEIRTWLLNECSAFHRRTSAYLAAFDKDIHPDFKREGGARVVVGTFTGAGKE